MQQAVFTPGVCIVLLQITKPGNVEKYFHGYPRPRKYFFRKIKTQKFNKMKISRTMVHDVMGHES